MFHEQFEHIHLAGTREVEQSGSIAPVTVQQEVCSFGHLQAGRFFRQCLSAEEIGRQRVKQALHIGTDGYPVEGGRCFSIGCTYCFIERLVKLTKETARQREKGDTASAALVRFGVKARIAVATDEGAISSFDAQFLAALVPQVHVPVIQVCKGMVVEPVAAKRRCPQGKSRTNIM